MKGALCRKKAAAYFAAIGIFSQPRRGTHAKRKSAGETTAQSVEAKNVSPAGDYGVQKLSLAEGDPPPPPAAASAVARVAPAG